MIAHCGLICDKCPVFLATSQNDDQERARVAKEWSENYGWPLKPEDINCDGCLAEPGRIFGYCSNCEVRKCATSRKLANCAPCPDYGCSKLEGIWALNPLGQKVLDRIRAESPR